MKQRKKIEKIQQDKLAAILEYVPQDYESTLTLGVSSTDEREDAAPAFSIGDNVKITSDWSMFFEQIGELAEIASDDGGRKSIYGVKFLWYTNPVASVVWFAKDELKKVEVSF